MTHFFKNFYLTIIFSSLTFCCYAQQWKWVKSTDGAGSDKGISIDADKYGNVYQIGSYSNSITSNKTILHSKGDLDFFITKHNFDGDPVWLKSFGGLGTDQANKIKTLPNGMFYVTGLYSQTVDFGGKKLTSKGDADIFIAKYDSEGVLIWANSAGGVGKDIAYGLTVDEEDNAYITGFFESNTIYFSGRSLKCLGEKDFFVAKYSDSGVLSWVKNYGGAGSEVGLDIFSSGKDLVIGGYFNGNTQIGKFALTNNGNDDVLIVKIDTTGKLVWATGVGSAGNDRITGVVISYFDDIYCSGFADLSFVNDTVKNESIFKGLGQQDAFLLRFNYEGKLDWVKTLGGRHNDLGTSIAIDNKNNIFVGGYLSPDDAENKLDSTEASRNYNSFLTRFNEDGKLIFAVKPQGTCCDDISGISARSGNVYFTGTSSSNKNFENQKIEILHGEHSFVGRFSLQSKKPNQQNAPKLKVGLFPNPITTNVNLLFQPELEDTFKKVEILNENEEVVKKDFTSGRYLNIKTPELSSGTYTLRIETEDSIELFELIVK